MMDVNDVPNVGVTQFLDFRSKGYGLRFSKSMMNKMQENSLVFDIVTDCHRGWCPPGFSCGCCSSMSTAIQESVFRSEEPLMKLEQLADLSDKHTLTGARTSGQDYLEIRGARDYNTNGLYC